MKRIERALNRLFHPPSEGIPERIFVTGQNEIDMPGKLGPG
jgi:hypothetical protein